MEDPPSFHSTPRRRVALLVGGDIAALTLFAAVGRASHGESLALLQLLGTSGPFILGMVFFFVLGFLFSSSSSWVICWWWCLLYMRMVVVLRMLCVHIHCYT